MKKRSSPGGRTSPGFFKSSTCALFNFVWPILTFRFQAELAANTSATVSDSRHGIANAHDIVSGIHRDGPDADTTAPDVRHDVSNDRPIVSEVHRDAVDLLPIVSEVQKNAVNTGTIVSNIHHSALKTHGGKDGQDRAVSTTRILLVTE